MATSLPISNQNSYNLQLKKSNYSSSGLTIEENRNCIKSVDANLSNDIKSNENFRQNRNPSPFKSFLRPPVAGNTNPTTNQINSNTKVYNLIAIHELLFKVRKICHSIPNTNLKFKSLHEKYFSTYSADPRVG